MRKLRRNLLLLILLCLTAGCKHRQKDNELILSGTLEMTEHGVGMPVRGRLAQVLVDEGDEVKTGQLLATLERYGQAEKDYERLVQLLARGGSNQQTVEQAALAVQDQRILSPVNGVVLTRVHVAGETVSDNSTVLILGDRSQLWVRIYVPENLISRVDLKGPATVQFDGLTRKFKGHVTFVASQAEFTPRNVQTPEERVTQTFAVKVTLDEVEPYLRPGVAADVTLPLREEGSR